MSPAQHPFLSPEWISAAKAIRDEYAAQAPALPTVSMNQVITDVPFGGGTLDAHVDTSSGHLKLDLGHLDGADLTLTLDYATARAVLVEQDPAAVIQAFFAGKITMQGDITKLMALQAGLSPTALADNHDAAAAVAEIGDRIRAITAE